jgi:hypothetical protein
MGSTSWAELYFRSLKLNKVLSLLTKYLLQYRRLSIPNVGTFKLVQQPAEFNVVDKLVLPPEFLLNWSHNDSLPEHQLSYLAASVKADKEAVRDELEQFGGKFKTKIEKESLSWKGIGTLKKDNGVVVIEKELLQPEGLNAVPAHRILRENVEHSMLVGDQQMTSQQVTDSLSQGDKKRSYIVIIGWILFALTLLAIVFLLYKNGFNPLSSGLKMKAAVNALY